MKYDELRCAVEKIQDLRRQLAATKEALRALGVTDLPGDAPNSPKSSDGSPGNLPGEPTEEMVAAAGDHLVDPRPMVEQALRAALAAAPRVEAEIPDIPEITQEDADAFMEFIGSTREGLCMVRARLIARMGAQS